MPGAMLRHRSAKGLRLPGTTGNYISSPDSVINSPTGDIDIRIYVKLADWTPASGTVDFISKWNASGNQRGWVLQTDGTSSGKLTFVWSPDGITSIANTTAVAPTVNDGDALWLRATLDVDNGAGGNDTKIYTSIDGITWTILGSTATKVGVTNLFDSTQGIELGAHANGSVNPLNGTIYYAEVRSGIDGPIIAKFDSSQAAVSGAQTPTSINGWTWNGAALYKRDDYVRFPGTSGNYLSWVDTPSVSITGDIDLRAKISLDDWSPATIQTILSNQSAGDPQRAWLFQVDGAGRLSFTWYPAGTAASQIQKNSTAAVGVADGSTLWVRATLVVSTGQATFYTSPDGVTWTPMTLPTAAGATTLVDTTSIPAIGARGAGINDLLSGNVYYAEIRNGIDGPVAANFNAADNQVQTPWTINGTGWNWEGSNFQGKTGVAFQLTLTSGASYASTPDSAASSVTGDIDVRAKIAANNWNTGLEQSIIAKYTTGSGRSYRLYIDSSGNMGFLASPDGTFSANFTAISTAKPPGVSNGSIKWVRATYVVATTTISFYTSDDGVAWTPLGIPVVKTLITGIFDSTSPVEVGSFNTGTLTLAGNIHYAEVRKGIDGPIVTKFDPTNLAKTGTKLPTSTIQPPGSPNMLSPNQASMETDASGYVASVNCTIAQDATQFLDGTKSLSLTSVAAGDMVATTPSATAATRFPVVPGKAYTVAGSARAATVSRDCRVQCWFYDAAGVALTFPGTGAINDVTTGWTSGESGAGLAGMVAPTGAATAVIALKVIATGAAAEVHYFDRISLVESSVPWTLNGANWDWVAIPPVNINNSRSIVVV